MNVRRIRSLTAVVAAVGMGVALTAGSPLSQATGAEASHWGGANATGALMNVASPAGQYQRNVQTMPTMAVDPVRTNVLAATSNDLVDMQPCSREAAVNGASCGMPANAQGGGTFNKGVGFSGVYFSFDSGRRWAQPTYQGLTAAGCDPTVEPCVPQPGPINTVPNYYENGLRAAGGSSVAFGPVLKNGTFSWANGSRLYLSTLVNNLTNTPIQPGRIDSTRTVSVSHIDNPTPARVADQSNWSAPAFVPPRTPVAHRPTAPQIWADNASSSRYFGRLYTCYNDFQFTPLPGAVGPIQPTLGVSSDGGQTWTTHAAAPPVNSASEGYRLACTVRTDSRGGVYAFFTHFSGQFPSFTVDAAQTIVKSFDGGATWTEPVDFMKMNTGCYYVDTIGDRCTEEGPAGTANEPGPSISIANGAPTGADATDEIFFAWSDGRFGQNQEAALYSYSTDRAKTWSTPKKVSRPGERVLYAAVAVAPNASRVYLTYNAFTSPFRPTTLEPRMMRGVLRSAVIGRHGAPGDWTTRYTGRSGDARGTSFAVWNYPEFLGFYVYAIATRHYGAGAWTDASRTAHCPAIDAWRQASLDADKVQTPAPWPQTDCPANFGNADLASATTAR
jgi:hypothetical protein